MSHAPRFSFYVIPFKDEPLETSVDRLARLGFDGFELPGEPSIYSPAEVNGLQARSGLKVSSVCGRMYGPQRDLTTANASDRLTAIDYFKSLVDLAAAVGSPSIILAPTAVRRNMPESECEAEWTFAVEGVSTIAAHARGTNVSVIVEPWNRYETHLVNRVEQALQLCHDVGAGHVGVMGDLFHMNIEETDIAAAIELAGDRLLNIHFADSNRRAPGRGHIDFVPVMSALQKIDYRHFVSTEFLAPRFIFEFGSPAEFYDIYPRETIELFRDAWNLAEELRAGAGEAA